MNARNPFLPVQGRIQRGNADIACEAGAIPPVSKEVCEIEQALDKITDPELLLAERDYSARLHATPMPDAPEAYAPLHAEPQA